MNDRKLVVIGGDAAGMSAASKVRRVHPDREIVVFERGNHTSYSACGMPAIFYRLGSGTNCCTQICLIRRCISQALSLARPELLGCASGKFLNLN